MASAIGSAEAYMNGWRRPQGERKVSEKRPRAGSMTASTISEIRITTPTVIGSMPITRIRKRLMTEVDSATPATDCTTEPTPYETLVPSVSGGRAATSLKGRSWTWLRPAAG